MAIKRLELRDFTAFRDATLELSPGLNVFIGENATGKTHAMKALYCIARVAADVRNQGPSIGQKLATVFRPDDGSLGRLGHRRRGQRTASLGATDDGGGTYSVSIATKSSTCKSQNRKFRAPTAVFVPSREALAMYEGFTAAYLKRELAFDETYFDLAVALSAAGLRGSPPRAFVETVGDLETALGGKIVLQGQRFYVRAEGGSMLEAPLLSEGMRKLGSILRLLQNGELRETGLLFWDEPEANLNPRLTVVVARALARLAAHNVQVVIASHDYLLTETLALLAREKNGPAARFFAFVREGTHVTVDGYDSLDDVEYNPIRNEFLNHYNRINGVGG